MVHGPLRGQWASINDAPHLWRKAPFVLLLASLFVFGCFPRLLTDKIAPALQEKLAQVFATPTATAASDVHLPLTAKLSQRESERAPQSAIRNQ